MASGRKRTELGGGAPGWMVTYGDMMSLLLGFFVLLLSFSTVNSGSFNRAMGSVKGSLGVRKTAREAEPPPKEQKRPEENKKLRSDTARQLMYHLQVRGLEKDVRVEYDAGGGIKVTLSETVLFDAGSASLKPSSSVALREIGEALAAFKDSFIEVRGHTDNSLHVENSTFADNYDLSYARARAVMRRLVAEGGIPERQVEVVACGENRPIAVNSTEEGRGMNRRVEIVVQGPAISRAYDSLARPRLSDNAAATPQAPQAPPVEPAK
jgi:chemotaxis protein MotB